MDLTDIWDEMGVEELSNRISAFFPSMDLSLEHLIGRLLKGEIFGVMREVFLQGITGITGGWEGFRDLFASLLLLGVISAVLLHVSDLFERYRIGEVSFYFTYLLQTAILVRCFSGMMEVTRAALDNIVLFIKLLMPTYLFAVGIATGSVTAGAGYQMVLFLIYGVEEILKGGFLPMITSFFLLLVLEGIQSRDQLEFLIELLRKAMNWGLKGALGALAGMSFLQAILTPALDGIKGSAIQKMVSAIPGIGSGAESIMQLALGSAVAIKNSMGIMLMLLLICSCMAPLAELFLFSVMLKVAAALTGIVSDKRLAKSVDRAGETGLLLFQVTGTAMLLFLLAIAVAAASVRR